MDTSATGNNSKCGGFMCDGDCFSCNVRIVSIADRETRNSQKSGIEERQLLRMGVKRESPPCVVYIWKNLDAQNQVDFEAS